MPHIVVYPVSVSILNILCRYLHESYLFWYFMNMKKNLFEGDEGNSQDIQRDNDARQIITESGLKEFSDKISRFIERAKELKSENIRLTRRILELENELRNRAIEIENLKKEKNFFKKEIEEVLKELEELDI